MPREYDYKCGTNYSLNQCNTATLKIHTCNSYSTNSHFTLILITNECFNVQNISYRAQCSGDNANLFKYKSLDYEGPALKDGWNDSATSKWSTAHSVCLKIQSLTY